MAMEGAATMGASFKQRAQIQTKVVKPPEEGDHGGLSEWLFP